MEILHMRLKPHKNEVSDLMKNVSMCMRLHNESWSSIHAHAPISPRRQQQKKRSKTIAALWKKTWVTTEVGGELGFEPCGCVHQQMICITDAKQVTHELNQEPV